MVHLQMSIKFLLYIPLSLRLLPLFSTNIWSQPSRFIHLILSQLHLFKIRQRIWLVSICLSPISSHYWVLFLVLFVEWVCLWNLLLIVIKVLWGWLHLHRAPFLYVWHLVWILWIDHRLLLLLEHLHLLLHKSKLSLYLLCRHSLSHNRLFYHLLLINIDPLWHIPLIYTILLLSILYFLYWVISLLAYFI